MSPPNRTLLGALGAPALLALVQQQLLVHQPPRLEQLGTAPASSGPAALQVRFSRPMETTSLQELSVLHPPLRHTWLGSGQTLQLSLREGQRLNQPLTVALAGADQRGLPLTPSQWSWDPRPRLVAVVSLADGEQLQVRHHDGRWQAISPVWPAIPVVLPLGNGEGVAAASQEENGLLRLWQIDLKQANLAPAAVGLGDLQAGSPRSLSAEPVTYAHLSSNRLGQLLIQSGSLASGDTSTDLLSREGSRSVLPWQATGPMQLLPGGGAVVVPDSDGLHLETLPPRPPRRQTLPGSRDLSSFCPQAGRALLVRHWPDFRRSLELVEPGRPPQQLWLGSEALVATACSRGGDRVWALLLQGRGHPELTLVALDRSGRILGRRRLEGWELEPGTGLSFDPSGERLLAALRPLVATDERPATAQPVLIDARSLELRPLERPIRQVHWLPSG